MSEKEPLRQEGERVVRLTIPDEEVKKWEETLREGGISEKEIRRILALKNETYKEEYLGEVLDEEGHQFNIDEQMEEIEADFRKQTGRDMTSEERQKRIDALVEVFKKVDEITEKVMALPKDKLIEPPSDFLEKLNRRIDEEQRKTKEKRDA